MLIKALQNFIANDLPDGTAGRVYDVAEPFGRHLIEIGVAVAVKMAEPAPEAKALPKPEAARPSSASQPGQASPEPTATPRRGRPRKSSQ